MDLRYARAEEVRDAVVQTLSEPACGCAAVWRAEAYRASVGLPMHVRRARALNAVLARVCLTVLPGAALQANLRCACDGSTCGRGVEAARAEISPLAGRSFATHSDHHAPDYVSLLRDGWIGLSLRAAERLEDEVDASVRDFLAGVTEALDGMSRLCRRWSASLADAARTSAEWSAALLGQSASFAHLADNPPRTFAEALQLILLTHCAWRLDDRYAMALGRLDQVLEPFRLTDEGAGRLAAEDGQELISHAFALLSHPYDIQNVTIGGLTREGRDGTNPVSYWCIEAARRIARPGGNLTARVHAGTPPGFLRAAAHCIRTGIGFPAMVNDAVLTPALVDDGASLEDARDFCFVGCIETFYTGRQAPWADSRFNLLRCAEYALRGGWDPVTGRRDGAPTPPPTSWNQLWESFCEQVREGVARHADWVCGLEAEADARAADLGSPLLSALTADCIARGRDVCDGGAVYPANHGIAGMGIGSAADTLAAVRHAVYGENRFLSMEQLFALLDSDFADAEPMRLRLRALPKFGNDDERVDGLAAAIVEVFGRAVLSHRTPSGGRFWGLMAANVQNIGAGLEVGATPDGRHARTPLSDAASPAFGVDRSGPTAAIRSVASLPYRFAPGGNVVNMRLDSASIEGEAGLTAIASLVRTCFDLGGAQLQFNTTSRRTLLEAMDRPEEYRSLVVRVSGFSAYFVGLSREVQEDILSRTEHCLA